MWLFHLGGPVDAPSLFIGVASSGDQRWDVDPAPILRPGDAIIDIDNHPIKHFAPPSRDSIMWRIITSEGTNITIKYVRNGQDHVTSVVPYKRPTKWYERKALRQILIGPEHKAIVHDVATNSPAALAGFREVTFVPEPIAAAYAADARPGTTLVFDFGGGTLDLCVVRREAHGLAVLATAGGPIGGDRATELLIDDAVAPRLGSRATWGPKQLRLPRYIVNALRDWHALSALNEKPLLDALDDLVRAGAPKRELSALRSAIELQLGYEIFQTVDLAKCELSDQAATLLSYHRANVDVDARLTRGRFERLIAALLGEVDALIGSVLRDAGLAPDAIGEVVYTGGSSAIPSVRALVRRLLPAAATRDTAAFTSVAAGLAMPGAAGTVATGAENRR